MAEPLPTPAEPIEQAEAPAPAVAEPPLDNGTAAIVTAPVPDVEMADSNPTPTEPTPQVPTVATPVAAATPTPAAAPTPSRNSPHPSTSSQAPTQPYPHGSPTRVYLNQHVTPHLLEAMKHLAATEPEKPLKYLSDFLAQKSAELEG
ncbi:hypothetical protein DM02DRAFT_608247 [Periconia macrospinosa]|uniref:Uncharacterized protein n=1 Tax=Periconia macrospinosa TaxID=97972 RepID=A0A2V1EDR4_9PLEO|nr:hypothetical protein DM02DRAFT_608247 [Periconia macrospinosa]